MNRPIKFRAWDTSQKRMIRWEELMRDKYLLWEFFGNVHYLKGSEEQIYRYQRMQSTGLKDAKGQEIWEGDLVKSLGLGYVGEPSEGITAKVEWSGLDFEPFGNDCGDCSGEPDWAPEDVEVIGNIWENPELLNEEEYGT